jgi:hypothetical protein
MSIRCCYGCPERTVTCHSTCGKYAKEVEKEKAKKNAIRKTKQQANAVESYICEKKTKNLKRWAR